MGLPAEDADLLNEWKDMIIHAKGAPPGDQAAQDAVRAQAGGAAYEYFGKLLAQRLEARAGDIVSLLVDAPFAGERELSHGEILNFLFLLFIAGLDTAPRAARRLRGDLPPDSPVRDPGRTADPRLRRRREGPGQPAVPYRVRTDSVILPVRATHRYFALHEVEGDPAAAYRQLAEADG